MARSNTWKKSFFFFPIICLTAGYVGTGHPICIVNMPHVTVINCHNHRLYRIPKFITITAFSGWTVNVCQDAYICLSCPSTPKLSSQPWSLLECHHVSISVSWVRDPWACPFYVASLSHNRKFFWAESSNRSGEEKKLSMYSLWPLSD